MRLGYDRDVADGEARLPLVRRRPLRPESHDWYGPIPNAPSDTNRRTTKAQRKDTQGILQEYEPRCIPAYNAHAASTLDACLNRCLQETPSVLGI
ncbi:hypothetical protein LB505_001085 [Fusarium chuoi]|nr:hypothetical protein LB505_001085 [Fusarium chuoi]